VADACREQQGRLAMAAIGRLDEAESTALAAHLDQCEACRAELAELHSVTQALDEADPERAGAGERPQPRPVLRQTVLAQLAAATARRRRRRAVMAMAAAAVVVVAALAVGVVTRSDGPVGEEVALTGPPGGSATATAVLKPRGWGTEIALEVAGLEPGTVYHLWLRQTDGSRVGAGSFVAVRSSGSMSVEGACALHADQAAGVGVSSRGETVLYGHLEGAPNPP
jgi:predicted anti-sigma-YlaC factor YlaD